jgi:hypothetical protein
MAKLSDLQKRALSEANYCLRRFGYGPFRATLMDGSGRALKLDMSDYSMKRVEGSAHIITRALSLIRRINLQRGTQLTFAEALELGTKEAQQLVDCLKGLQRLGIRPDELGSLDRLRGLDVTTMKIVIHNSRDAVVYKSGK